MGLQIGQAVTFEDLRTLVTNGTFSEKYSFSENTRKLVTSSQIQDRINIETLTGSGLRAVRFEELASAVVETTVNNIDADVIALFFATTRTYGYSVTNSTTSSIYGNRSINRSLTSPTSSGMFSTLANYPASTSNNETVDLSVYITYGSGNPPEASGNASIYAYYSQVNIKKIFSDNPSLTELKFSTVITKNVGAPFNRYFSLNYRNNARVTGDGTWAADGGTLTSTSIAQIYFDTNVTINYRVVKLSGSNYDIHYSVSY